MVQIEENNCLEGSPLPGPIIQKRTDDPPKIEEKNIDSFDVDKSKRDGWLIAVFLFTLPFFFFMFEKYVKSDRHP